MRNRPKIGTWVEVRSKEEILRTLDVRGSLDGLLFMPEMLQYCGRRFQVWKSAHKSCDYTTPYPYRSRRIEGSVLLETRCDGSGHGECQAGCTILWKEAWLKPVGSEFDGVATEEDSEAAGEDLNTGMCREHVLWERAQALDPADELPQYFCQATEVQKASAPLSWWDIRQYIEDLRSGNTTARQLSRGLVYSAYYHLTNSGIGVGTAMRWLYNRFCWVWRGPKWPRTPGLIPEGKPTPAVSLDLQPGEMVRVKSHDEILRTVDSGNRNRGMYWDAELVPYCGGTYKVLRRVSRIIVEATGKMIEMKTPCIVLEGVVCQARYSQCRMFCPRAMYPYWREIWLERAEGTEGTDDG